MKSILNHTSRKSTDRRKSSFDALSGDDDDPPSSSIVELSPQYSSANVSDNYFRQLNLKKSHLTIASGESKYMLK